jgi:hypothetical protein
MRPASNIWKDAYLKVGILSRLGEVNTSVSCGLPMAGAGALSTLETM